MNQMVTNFFGKNTISLTTLAITLVLVSGFGSANGASVVNVNPKNNEIVYGGNTIDFNCSVSKGDYALHKLELYVDGSLKKTINSPQEGINTFQDVDIGTVCEWHTYYCKAYDAGGWETASDIWDFSVASCIYNEECCTGCCPPGYRCKQFQEGDCTWCECVPEEVPPVPEFASLAVALAILLTAPAFAYLLVKRKLG